MSLFLLTKDRVKKHNENFPDLAGAIVVADDHGFDRIYVYVPVSEDFPQGGPQLIAYVSEYNGAWVVRTVTPEPDDLK